MEPTKMMIYTGCPKKVHTYVQVLFNFETKYTKDFKLNFYIECLKIKQKLTELWELQDKNAFKREDPFKFSWNVGVSFKDGSIQKLSLCKSAF